MQNDDEVEYPFPSAARSNGKSPKAPKGPKAPKVPGAKGGGGGGKVSIKKSRGGKVKAAPKPAKFERAGESSRKLVAASQKPSPASSKFLPKPIGRGPGKKRKVA